MQTESQDSVSYCSVEQTAHSRWARVKAWFERNVELRAVSDFDNAIGVPFGTNLGQRAENGYTPSFAATFHSNPGCE